MNPIVLRTKSHDTLVLLFPNDGNLYEFNKTKTQGVFKKGGMVEACDSFIQIGEVGRGVMFDYDEEKNVLVKVPDYCKHKGISVRDYWLNKKKK